MAAPNVVSLTSMLVKSIGLECSGGDDTLLTAGASTAVNVVSLYAANVHETLVGTITVKIVKALGSGTQTITHKQRVPLKQTINVLLGKELYLEENDSITVTANAASNIHVVVSYAEMT